MVDNDNFVEIENASEIKLDAVDPLNSSITDDSTVNDETIIWNNINTTIATSSILFFLLSSIKITI